MCQPDLTCTNEVGNGIKNFPRKPYLVIGGGVGPRVRSREYRCPTRSEKGRLQFKKGSGRVLKWTASWARSP